MQIIKKTVDFNSYISDLKCAVIADGDGKHLLFSFKNKNHGIIAAIKLSCVAYDSFGDKIRFDGNEFLEIKKADLQINPYENSSFSIDIENYDVKKVEVSVAQLVYTNGENVIPKEPRIVEYDVEVLSSIGKPDSHFEKDALSIMKEKNDLAICFPKIHPEGWVCVCGVLNSEFENTCSGCGNDKQRVFTQFNQDIIKAEIEEREKKEQEKIESRKEQEKIEQEKKRKKKILVMFAIALAIVIGVVYVVTYRIKYGLSDEEKVQYDIAQMNYSKIELFIMALSSNYFSVAQGYSDDNYNYSHEQENRMSEAEKNEEYLYTRGIYLASGLLYDLIEDQYPEKYHSIYTRLVELRKSYVYNNILLDERLYVENGLASDLLDRQNEIKEAISNMETYMDNEILNPANVEINITNIPTPDYSIVYGIKLGILYYEDGSIKYVGEVSNGQANGFGSSWYSVMDGGGWCCEGVFENGVFQNGDSYDKDGNTLAASELSGMVFTGDFEMVEGLSNNKSSGSVAQQNANNEEQDRSKAQAAVKDYLNMLINNQRTITNISWFNIPEVSGSYYFFSCTVEYGDLKREGTVTVKKESDGTFTVTGLDFDD